MLYYLDGCLLFDLWKTATSVAAIQSLALWQNTLQVCLSWGRGKRAYLQRDWRCDTGWICFPRTLPFARRTFWLLLEVFEEPGFQHDLYRPMRKKGLGNRKGDWILKWGYCRTDTKSAWNWWRSKAIHPEGSSHSIKRVWTSFFASLFVNR